MVFVVKELSLVSMYTFSSFTKNSEGVLRTVSLGVIFVAEEAVGVPC